MKRIKHMICNAITKLQNKDEKQYQPIVFLNSPISDETEDVLGIKSAADAIVEAVGQSANMIGLIADYGAGKSSLTSMLAEDKCHFRKVIHINMWDTISGLSEKSSNNDAVGALTKSFVFQLAAGVSENTARYVNRRLSRNFGIISFSLSSLAFWVWFVAAALCYGIYAIINSIDVAVLGSFIRSVNGSIAIESATVYAEMSKSIAPVFPVIGVILLLLGLRNTNVAYSYWKTNNLEPEINDIFEAYYFIYKRLLRRKKHTLIVIEDLDRISDRALVVGFLREVYRFGSIVPPTKKNAPVFLIAVMPEVNLTNRKSEISEEQSEEVNSLENKNDHEAIYEKLFDYTVSLRPIHYEDYADIMLDIIGSDVSDRKKVINELLDEKKIEDNLPSSFNWLIKGHNLTMRQLKERLNAAMALLVTLKNKGYAN